MTCWDFTLSMAREAHFSWVGPWNFGLADPASAGAHGLTPAQFSERVRALNRTLGYEFRLDRLTHTKLRTGQPTTFTIAGVNQGVAPFYYPWPVELALLDTTIQPPALKQLITTSTDLRTWHPGKFSCTATPLISVLPGTYALAVGIRDPWKNEPSIGFANSLPVVQGWTVLTSVNVSP